MKSTSIWYTKSRNKYSTHTWSFSHEYAPHIVLVRIVSRQPHPGLLHQPEEAAVLGLPPPVALPLALAALARHRPLHLGRARQDDVGGARQHQDRRRVLAQLVVQLLGQQICRLILCRYLFMGVMGFFSHHGSWQFRDQKVCHHLI